MGESAYLVVRHQDGFGEVFPLAEGQAFTLGRAPTNQVVLKDDLCSREHAEVTQSEGAWWVRDLDSLNGTLVNGDRVDTQWELEPRDEVLVGRTTLVFVEDMTQLPGLPNPPKKSHLSIKKRLGETRFLTPIPEVPTSDKEEVPNERAKRHSLSRALSQLFRLALKMGAAQSVEQLCRDVLVALLDAVPAEIGAILAPKGGGALADPGKKGSNLPTIDELELLDSLRKEGSTLEYQRVSARIYREVLQSREAVLAEDDAREHQLRDSESPKKKEISSLICAPILCEQGILGVVHLYCTDPHSALDGEDLEFTMAVSRQLGIALNWLQRDESLTAANQSLRSQLEITSELVGNSSAIADIEEQIQRVAPTHATCLIRGESGVGKELVARGIHFNSPRRDGPFVCLNCAALTETLLESELFGHERGAFTGATDKKIGKFEAAHRGTIFLDEIGEMNVGTQAKLLRILEGQPYERVGGSEAIQVDVRVVAATNKPLEEGVKDGTFRRDLFFRLQVVELTVPPLRERKDDIPTLAEFFLDRFSKEMGRKIKGFTPAALDKLTKHEWPGNVRELRNSVERAVALSTGTQLDATDIWLTSLDLAQLLSEDGGSPGVYQARSLSELEKEHIERTLQHTEWNKSQAANILQIERSTLDRKIDRYGLKRDG